MNILSFYTHYRLPPNLQRHQLEVASVVLYVIDHWQGPKLDKTALIEAGLLHDMGNIVKFKRPFLGEMADREEYWGGVQDEFVKKYGSRDAHVVTEAILREFGARPKTLAIVEETGGIVKGDIEGKGWEARIVDFADCCVVPAGIVSFDERIEDLKNRYNMTEESNKIQVCRRNAAEVQSNVDVDLLDVGKQDYSEARRRLEAVEVPTRL